MFDRFNATNTTDPRPIRPAAGIEGLRPYSPGHDPYAIDLRLDRNERIPPLPIVEQALRNLDAACCSLYPDKKPLESAIARRLGTTDDHVLVTNGGDDAIDRACRAMLEPGTAMLTHTPSFEMIERSARIVGAVVRTVDWIDGLFPVDTFCRNIDARVRIIALVTPNNPTGLEIDVSAIQAIARAAPASLVLVDLAYIEFADTDPTVQLLQESNIVVIRTFSKAYGLAGMRIGYAVSSPSVINWMRSVGGPYPTSAVSLEIARRVMESYRPDDDTYIDEIRRERASLRAFLQDRCQRVWPSSANFVLAQFADAAAVRTAIARRGIAVRGFSGSSVLSNCLRITCPGEQASFDRIQNVLCEVCACTNGDKT